jgi:hypothetical protein
MVLEYAVRRYGRVGHEDRPPRAAYIRVGCSLAAWMRSVTVSRENADQAWLRLPLDVTLEVWAMRIRAQGALIQL